MQLLARTMVDPGEQYASDQKPVLRVDDFKQIYLETVAFCAEEATNSNFGKQVSAERLQQLVLMLDSIGYYILDETSVQNLFKLVNQNLNTESLDKIDSCRI